MNEFFEQHSRFFETSYVGAWPERLSSRYEAIVESNRHAFENARVLDLASHDGRWSLAAIRAGAAHVTGIEVRPELVQAAKDNLLFYGVPEDRFEFSVGDLNHKLSASGKYDLVLCLGYFYHTLNHMALFEYIASTGARHVILDGMVEPGNDPTIRVYAEDIVNHANGMTAAGVLDGKILVGHPSVTVIRLMLAHFGYRCVFYDWQSLIHRHGIACDPGAPHSAANPIGDYARGARATAFATRQT